MGKKGKKDKAAAAEAARLAAEEEAARLEEERLKREAEEAKLRAEEEARLAAEEAERLRIEAERLAKEREEISEEIAGLRSTLAAHESEESETFEWTRYLECSPLPDPRLPPALHQYEATQNEEPDDTIEGTLRSCLKNETVVTEAEVHHFKQQAKLRAEAAATSAATMSRLREITAERVDKATAHVLQHADEYANDESQVQVTASVGAYRFGLWVNIAKNPRLKLVEMPELMTSIELPKSLALASVAIRVLHTDYDELSPTGSDKHMGIGGVFYLDLLALPPPPKKVKGWTLRQVTPLSTKLQKLNYPLAGGDDDAVPPIGFSVPISADIIRLDADPKVGLWDAEARKWTTDSVTDVRFSQDGSVLSFQSTKVAPFALIQSRTKLCPFRGWLMRPLPALDGAPRVEMSLHVGLEEPFIFEITESKAMYAGPSYPQLASLEKVWLTPRELLARMSEHGLHLLPEDFDSAEAGIVLKDPRTEELLCEDIGMICQNYLVSGCRYNQFGPPSDLLVRISEISDMGRTSREEATSIFSKEKTGEGERQTVQVAMRREKGLQLVEGVLNRDPTHSPVPTTAFHASWLVLMAGEMNAPKEVVIKPPAAPLRLIYDAIVDSENDNGVEANDELDFQAIMDDLDSGEKERPWRSNDGTISREELGAVTQVFNVSLTEDQLDKAMIALDKDRSGKISRSELARALQKLAPKPPPPIEKMPVCLAAGTLSGIQSSSAVLTETIKEMLYALRIFSFA